MKPLFTPNISRGGRIARAVVAFLLLAGAIVALGHVRWLAVLLFISSGFVFFEAIRGWCVVRACGIKTRM